MIYLGISEKKKEDSFFEQDKKALKYKISSNVVIVEKD